MAGYSGKPLTQKLGIQPGFGTFVDGAPAAYGDNVGELPAGLKFVIPKDQRKSRQRKATSRPRAIAAQAAEMICPVVPTIME